MARPGVSGAYSGHEYRRPPPQRRRGDRLERHAERPGYRPRLQRPRLHGAYWRLDVPGRPGDGRDDSSGRILAAVAASAGKHLLEQSGQRPADQRREEERDRVALCRPRDRRRPGPAGVRVGRREAHRDALEPAARSPHGVGRRCRCAVLRQTCPCRQPHRGLQPAQRSDSQATAGPANVDPAGPNPRPPRRPAPGNEDRPSMVRRYPQRVCTRERCHDCSRRGGAPVAQRLDNGGTDPERGRPTSRTTPEPPP